MADNKTRSGAHGKRCPVARKGDGPLGRSRPQRAVLFIGETPLVNTSRPHIAEAFLPRTACPMTIRLAADVNFMMIETA